MHDRDARILSTCLVFARQPELLHNSPVMDYFKMTPAELEQAKKILATRDTDIDRYDLEYGYDEDLNEAPDVPEDMNDYADVLEAQARVEMEKPEARRNWESIAKDLGLAGALRKIAGGFEKAEKLLRYSLQLCLKHKLPEKLRLQQAIRLADVKKREGHLEEALQDLENLMDDCLSNPELELAYKDVILQHTGKVHFAMGDYHEALTNFQAALSIRTKKGDMDLISSTQTAIAACKERIQ